MWNTLLIDQFHDVLPGTSIGLVYEDTRENARKLTEQTDQLAQAAVSKIVKNLVPESEVEQVIRFRDGLDEVSLPTHARVLVVNSLTGTGISVMPYSR